MGLDMYLHARKHFLGIRSGDDEIAQAIRKLAGVPEAYDKFHNGVAVEVTALYWRKANQIHAWFVANVQDGNDDCGEYYVSREHLDKLRETCKAVLAAENTPEAEETAQQLLPPQPGFFFGTYEIDEGYYEDLQYTVKGIDYVLENFPAEGWQWEFEYHSSW
jgi:hypothetical protein